MLDALCFNTSNGAYYSSDSFSVDRNIIRMVNQKRILNFKNKKVNNNKENSNLLNQVSSIVCSKINQFERLHHAEQIHKREISSIPEKILDAPNLVDDYYLNLLDWGKKNVLAVALGKTVYLWNNQTGQTYQLCEDTNNICSVNWMGNGVCLAVGLYDGSCVLYDIEKLVRIRKMDGHKENSRVSALSWNKYIISTGGKDGNIINHDVRDKKHIIHMLKAHRKEVCQLKWSLDGEYLASGGNDNLVNIWEVNTSKTFSQLNLELDNNENEKGDKPPYDIYNPKFCLTQHSSAVKALAWSPFQRNILVSGGGTRDKKIKIWNSDNGSLINSFDTGSQVCSLLFNKYEREIISSHGFSKNQISIWSYPSMKKITELTGHTNRVLYTSMSPDHSTLVSGSPDETLRFWKINNIEKINEYEVENMNKHRSSYKRSKKKNCETFGEINIR